MTFGENLKELLETFGISQEELSKLTGIHSSSISAYVNGKIKKPRYRNIHKIEKALGVNLEEFYTKKDRGRKDVEEVSMQDSNKLTLKIRLKPFNYSIPFTLNFRNSFKSNIAKKKISIKQLSKISGISQGSLHSYLRGSTLPNLDVAIIIADCLGISLDELTGYDKECLARQYKIIEGNEEISMGKRLDKILREAKVSKSEFAELTGISKVTIIKYTLGKLAVPRLDSVIYMAYVLEMSIDALVGHKTIKLTQG